MDGRKGDLSVGEWGSAGMDRTSIGKGNFRDPRKFFSDFCIDL